MKIDSSHRSQCPINLALELIGDRWSLLIVRDLMFAGKRHFREFLGSDEAISSNILTERLNRLVEAGILSKSADASHKQKAIYSLTSRGIALLPVVVQLGIWGKDWLPVTAESSAMAVKLEKGGTASLRTLERGLRKTHLQLE